MPPRGRNQRSDLPPLRLGFSIDHKQFNAKLERYKGRFDAASNELREVHDEAAALVQNYMVEELEKAVQRTGRPQRRTNLLSEALMDQENVRVTNYGFQVGREDWLDASPAGPYWERLELGEARRPGGMYGRYVRASFYSGNLTGRRTRPSPERFRMDMRMPHVRVDSDTPGAVQIGRRIPAYGYMRKGGQKFLRRGDGTANGYAEYLFQQYRDLFQRRYGISIERDSSGLLRRGSGNRHIAGG